MLAEGGEPEAQAAFDRAAAGVAADALASIVYTSGTTGSPKGVMLTHGNFASQAECIHIGERLLPGEVLLSILPTWHAYERAVEYYALLAGVTISYTDKRHLRADLEQVRPHLFPCVPRIWETVYDGIMEKVAKMPAGRQRTFHFFLKAGERFLKARRTVMGGDARRRRAGAVERLSAAIRAVALWPVHWVGYTFVFAKPRAAMTGGRIRAAVSGGGSLAPYLDDFLDVIGVPILNGYGLTETSPVLSIRRLDHRVAGTVGPPLARTVIEIRNEAGVALPQGETGLVFAKGPQVMRGYYENPEATAKVLSADGWFNTGDLGYLTPDGDLAITGRAKDTIVLASGENVEPEPIENVARRSPLVSQVVVVGQDQNTLAALVVPNGAALSAALALAAEASLADAVAAPGAAKAVQRSIADAMKADGGFKASEAVAKVHLLAEPFSEANGLLTQTMKVKRNAVAGRHAEAIKALFAQ